MADARIRRAFHWLHRAQDESQRSRDGRVDPVRWTGQHIVRRAADDRGMDRSGRIAVRHRDRSARLVPCTIHIRIDGGSALRRSAHTVVHDVETCRDVSAADCSCDRANHAPDSISSGNDALARIGATVAPIALFAVGCQLRLGELWSRRGELALGLGYKLVLGPLLIAALCLVLLDSKDPETAFAQTVVIFEAAMGPMIGAAVVANHYKLDSALTSLMVGIGIPLSLLIAPLWLNVANSMA